MVLIGLLCLVGCKKSNENKVVIYSCAEDYRNEFYLNGLKEKFPEYDITLEYMTSGNAAAKLKAEGTKTEGDILLSWESGYIDMISNNLAVLDWVDYSIYEDGFARNDKKSVPELRNSGAIIVNPKVLQARSLEVPSSYQDLLDPKYKGLISMPNPKSSGTGYMFLKNLVNVFGEDEAFAYFDALSENITQFTSSGSGPINAVVQEEAAIALGMTAQAVTMINEGVNLDILVFEEGAPYSAYEVALVLGKEQSEAVRNILDFLISDLIPACDELYFPEKVYKNKEYAVKNYPQNIVYGDMSNNTSEEKTRLLAK